MRLYFKKFIGDTDSLKQSSAESTLSLKFKNERMCQNCRKRIYNVLGRDPYFCSKHLSPIRYYEICAYFVPIWQKLL